MKAGACRHFNGIRNAGCDVGVAYADVRDNSQPFALRLPCLGGPAKCDKLSPYTKEEEAKWMAEVEAMFKRTNVARKAILATKKPAGQIDCPVCGAAGALAFSVSNYNGHVHARCSTADCVRWME